MLEYYWAGFLKWLDKVVPAVVNEKYFLCIMGSIFLFGIVTKWVVIVNYGRLIRKAENMTNPKNATLRQIKMRFDSVKQIHGSVSNPMILVQRQLNKCKAGIFSLNKLNNIINWCIICIVGFSGLLGLELYRTGSGKTTAMAYILTGCFFGFALEMINRCTDIREKQMELTYIIVDFLENNAMTREERHIDSLMDVVSETAKNDVDTAVDSADSQKENEKKRMEEQILNQVIGEFLQ